jgi:hypothetical protein
MIARKEDTKGETPMGVNKNTIMNGEGSGVEEFVQMLW